MRTRLDAIVVGAGPAGATAATLLARAGWAVALVEKQVFPRRKVCGECIAASNGPLLDALGLGPAVDAAAGPALRRVALWRGAQGVVADLPAADDARHAWGRALGRETLDTLLLERARAAGAQVWQPWSVQAVEGGAGDWRCALRAAASDERMTLGAPLVVDAHGSWQALPSGRPAPRRARRPDDLYAFKANFRGAALADGLLPVLAFPGGYGGLVVAGDGVLTLACCIRADRLDAARRAAPASRAGEAVEALLARECHGVAAALAGARRDGAWLAAGPLDPGVRLGAGQGGDASPLRIGNAAGEAHPIIGEGMSMAMQSAWLLCARLLSAGRPTAALADAAWQRELRARHAAEWRRRFVPRLRLAAAFAHASMRPAASAPLAALLARWPALLTHGARWGGKVDAAPDPATIAWLAAGACARRPTA